ncbi:MAG: hypothetical protein ACYSUI_10225 [Planctomycetota bacterium]|jgi:hypothetical protein
MQACGKICIEGSGSISVSGGANVSLDTWRGSVSLGADITGTGSTRRECPSSRSDGGGRN